MSINYKYLITLVTKNVSSSKIYLPQYTGNLIIQTFLLNTCLTVY